MRADQLLVDIAHVQADRGALRAFDHLEVECDFAIADHTPFAWTVIHASSRRRKHGPITRSLNPSPT